MNRLTVIDAAKGLGIILVVLGHTQEPKLLTLILYSFHMPLFFFLAGFTFNPCSYSNKIIWQKKFQRLLVPYFISNLLFYCYWFIVERSISNVSPIAAFLGIFNGNSSHLEANAVLWFLTALFCSEIIFFYLIGFLSSKKTYMQLFLVLVIGLIGYSFSRFYILPWGIDVALVAQLFLFVGYKFKENDILNKRLFSNCLFNIGLCIVLAAGIYVNGKVDMGSRNYGNILFFCINGLLGSMLVLVLSKVFGSYFLRALSFLGKNSLVIFIFHIHTFKIINNLGLSLRYWPIFLLLGTLMPLVLNKPFNKLLSITDNAKMKFK